MARVTNVEALARRQRVGELWVRAFSAAGIARTLGVDEETVRRDVGLLGKQAAADTDLARERHRLLLGARQVEQECWRVYAALPASQDSRRLAALARALAAQAQALTVVGELAGAALEARLTALEERLSTPSGAPPSWALSRRN